MQVELVSAEPQGFFRPTPSASGTFSTWLGMYLDDTGDNRVDWNETPGSSRELADVVIDYRVHYQGAV